MVLVIPWDRIAFVGADAGMTAAAFFLKLLMLDALVPIPSIQFGANGVSWSLSTEMFFYLAFPLLIARFGSTWARKLTLAAVLAIAAYALAAWCGMPEGGVSDNQ